MSSTQRGAGAPQRADDGPLREGLMRAEAAIDLVLALLLVLLSSAMIVLLVELLPVARRLPMLVLLLMQGPIVLAGIAALLAWRRQRWCSLGLVRFASRDLGRAVVALLAIFVVNLLFQLLLEWITPGAAEEHVRRIAELGRQLSADVPFAGVLAAMLFVGFYEELFARGLLLQRCRRIFAGFAGRLGAVALPVVLSSLLFGLGHAYQGWIGVAQTALIGAVLAWLTLRWGTLWPAMLAHAGLNGISLTVARFWAGSG